jgi:hypothetical protein
MLLLVGVKWSNTPAVNESLHIYDISHSHNNTQKKIFGGL